MEATRTTNKVIFGVTKRPFVFVVTTVLLSIFIIGSTFRAQAEIAIVLPSLYSVSGSSLSEEDQGLSSYTQYEYEWNDFTSEMPKGAAVGSIFLKLAWSIAETKEVPVINSMEGIFNGVHEEASLINSESPSESDALPEPEVLENIIPSETETPSIDQYEEGVSGNEAPQVETEDSAPLEESSSTEELQTYEGAIEVQDLVLDSHRYPLAFAQSEEGLISDSGPDSIGSISAVRTDEEGQEGYVSTTEDGTTELADVVTDSDTSVGDAESVIESPDASVNEVSSPEVAEPVVSEVAVTDIQNQYDTTVFEVLYSLDGESWQHVGEGDLYSLSSIELPLPLFSPEEINDLRIKVRYVATEENDTKIYFDTMHLLVEYTTEEIIIEPEVILTDLEPNFNISAIKADVQSGNIRAVIIEKGGMSELWYAITNTTTHEVAWNKLVNDSALDSSATLGIKGRIIFWLDKNQQTLFGFDIDEQSIFGKPLSLDEDNFTSLHFEDENLKQWEVIPNPETNSFDFSKQNLEQ